MVKLSFFIFKKSCLDALEFALIWNIHFIFFLFIVQKPNSFVTFPRSTITLDPLVKKLHFPYQSRLSKAGYNEGQLSLNKCWPFTSERLVIKYNHITESICTSKNVLCSVKEQVGNIQDFTNMLFWFPIHWIKFSQQILKQWT